LKRIGLEVVPSFFGFANITRALGVTYPRVFGHLWSLAVELQLYLLWAPMVILSLKRSRKTLFVVGLSLLTFSVGYRYFLNLDGAIRNEVYNSTACRAASFLFGSVGAMLLYLKLNLPAFSVKSVRMGLRVLFLASIVLHFYALKYATIGAWGRVSHLPLLVSVSSGIIVVTIAANVIEPVTKCLSFLPLRYLGLISYGAFLWHYPLLMFYAKLVKITGMNKIIFAGAASIAIGAFSYHFVEKRFLKKS